MYDLRKKYAHNLFITERKIKEAEAWAEWLPTLDWTYFITPTTPYELTLNSARMTMQRFFNWLPSPKLMFWVAERFECKDGFHTHGLLQTFLTVPKICKQWQIATGMRNIKNTAPYISIENNWQMNENGSARKGNVAHITAKKYVKELGAERYCAEKLLYLYKEYDLL